jgi:hypothetical protein
MSDEERREWFTKDDNFFIEWQTAPTALPDTAPCGCVSHVPPS